MLEKSISVDVRTGSARRRVLSGAGVGAAVGTAVVAIIASIVMWGVRSSREFTSFSLNDMGVVAIVTGVCVLALLATWLLRRYPALRRVRIGAGFIAVGLGAWSVWNVVGLYRSRDALPFVDSTGATVVAAIAATVAAVATTAFGRDVSGRAAVCAFLVVALAAPALTYWAVRNHRDRLWHPELTAVASVPAPVPDMIGPVGYRIDVGGHGYQYPDIYAAGNGSSSILVEN
jgi:hypothetical protein